MTEPEYMLTTVDNPYSPFTNYDEWRVFDSSHGYHSQEFLARVSFLSPDLSDADEVMCINRAIEEIVNENVSGMWRKVTEADYPSTRGGT